MLTIELAAVISEASHTHFYRRLELLKDLIDSWKSGTEVALADLDEGENYFFAFFLGKLYSFCTDSSSDEFTETHRLGNWNHTSTSEP